MGTCYEGLEVNIILFKTDDIVRTSVWDNVTEFPDYPENFGMASKAVIE